MSTVRQLIKMFKFRVVYSHSARFVTWVKNKDILKEFHHVAGRKTTDYLGVLLSRGDHSARHQNSEKHFEEDLIEAINNLISYTQHLEKLLENR